MARFYSSYYRKMLENAKWSSTIVSSNSNGTRPTEQEMRWTEKLLKGTVEQKAPPKAHIKSGAQVDIACFFFLSTSLYFLCVVCTLHQKNGIYFIQCMRLRIQLGMFSSSFRTTFLSVFLSHTRISQSFEYINPIVLSLFFLSFVFLSLSHSFSRLLSFFLVAGRNVELSMCLFACK